MKRLLMNVLWPSFLTAILAEGAFFSVFDPRQLPFLSEEPEFTPLAVYTIGFFFFWIFCGLSSSMTSYLLHIPSDNKSPHETGAGLKL